LLGKGMETARDLVKRRTPRCARNATGFGRAVLAQG